jgi:hypothetical protein
MDRRRLHLCAIAFSTGWHVDPSGQSPDTGHGRQRTKPNETTPTAESCNVVIIGSGQAQPQPVGRTVRYGRKIFITPLSPKFFTRDVEPTQDIKDATRT